MIRDKCPNPKHQTLRRQDMGLGLGPRALRFPAWGRKVQEGFKGFGMWPVLGLEVVEVAVSGACTSPMLHVADFIPRFAMVIALPHRLNPKP